MVYDEKTTNFLMEIEVIKAHLPRLFSFLGLYV
jgi:hypothetical protein